jgi:NAD(P)-dependent dehydrogenase (short-subunit alcohol dehydrogenase family)
MTATAKVLDGTVSLVTGAGRGIGRAIACSLAEAGSHVVLAARSVNQLREVAQLVEESGRSALVVELDVTDSFSVSRAVGTALDRFGRIDLLVNNAGSNSGGEDGAVGPLWSINPAIWWHDVTVNLYGPVLMANAVLPAMIERESGRIINIAARTSARPAPFDSAYGCSKAGLVRLTDSLSLEVKDHGVAVFALSPGAVQTDLLAGSLYTEAGREYLGGVSEALRESFIGADVPARAVVYLASGQADGLSGRFVHVTDDLAALAARSSEIVEHDLYQLRYRTEL